MWWPDSFNKQRGWQNMQSTTEGRHTANSIDLSYSQAVVVDQEARRLVYPLLFTIVT